MEKLLEKEIEKLTLKQLEKLIPYLSDKYYNDQPIVSDEYFDQLVEELKKRDPKNRTLNNIGAPVRDDVLKVKLPLWLGSQNKAYPKTRELSLWLERNPDEIIISDKLDGLSCLIYLGDSDHLGDSNEIEIYTRGDGKIGQDISYLAKYIKLPQKYLLCKYQDIYVRGELIITKKDYENKYKSEFAISRSVVSGVINSKRPNSKILKDIKFVAYEIIDLNSKYQMPIEDQLKKLKELGFETPYYVKGEMDGEELSKLLEKRKKEGKYEVDGLVLTNNLEYIRNKERNPKYSIAFKINEESKTTIVREVRWNPSKHKKLIPVLIFDPVNLGGSNVEKCTAYNADYIRKNKIGAGTKINVTMGGDIIPKIERVLEPTKASFPEVGYHWSENDIDIIMDKDDDDVLIRKLVHMFNNFEIDGLKEGTVKKLVDAGYRDLKSIYEAGIEDFLQIEGFKEKSATNIYENIHKVMDKDIDIVKLMAGSLVFALGIGKRKLKPLIEKYPKIIEREEITLEEIIKVDGFSKITADKFLEGYDDFWKWIDENPFIKISQPKVENISPQKEIDSFFTNKYVVMTGFRDKELSERITREGGFVQNSVNKKTTLLIVKDKDATSNKITKAREMGIEIISREEV